MKGLITGWIALAIVLAVLFFVKLMISAALKSEGKSIDWSSYNTILTVLAFVTFLPVALIWTLLKKSK